MPIEFNRYRDAVIRSYPVSCTLHYSINYNASYERRTISDVVTEDYHRKVKAGEIIVNPLDFRCETMLLPSDQISWASEGNPGSSAPASGSANFLRSCIGYVPQTADFIGGSGNLPGIPCSFDQSDEADLRKQTALAFVDKPQYDFGEDLAELRETLIFIRNPLRSLIDLIKSFERKASRVSSFKGRLRSATEKAQHLADVWASYSFAARPLIQSIDNALDALEDDSVLPLRRTSRSKSRLEDRTVQDVEGSHSSGSFARARITNVRTVDFHVGVIYDAPQRGGLRSYLGLRNKDLLVTAWEVVPLSFMIDRIVSVKNVISSVINLVDPTVEVKGGFVMKRQRDSHTVQMRGLSLPEGSWLTAYSPLPHYHEIFTMTREEWLPNVTNIMPLPNPGQLIKDASATADLAALVTLRLSPLLLRSLR